VDRKHDIVLEVDAFLENGEKVMIVEIKSKPSTRDIDEHLERMDKLRTYADLHEDRRKYLGAVALDCFGALPLAMTKVPATPHMRESLAPSLRAKRSNPLPQRRGSNPQPWGSEQGLSCLDCFGALPLAMTGSPRSPQ
jgi:hypothetical protein